MAVTDYDFNLTRTEILERAFRILGVVSPGQQISSEESEQARIALNAMVNRWQADHIFLWTEQSNNIPLTNATQNYTLPLDPNVVSVDTFYLTKNGYDTPLEVISYREFMDIHDKDAVGEPDEIAVKMGEGDITILVHPVPAVATGLSLTYLCTVKLKDFDSANSNPNLRHTWLDALSYGLAANLCDEYSIPISEREYISRKATEFYRTAKKNDVRRPTALVTRGAY